MRIPDSKSAREVTNSFVIPKSDLLFHHSVRVYFWGSLDGEPNGYCTIGIPGWDDVMNSKLVDPT
jgi:hypothetical protein